MSGDRESVVQGYCPSPVNLESRVSRELQPIYPYHLSLLHSAGSER